jgi:ParB family chromosome partitioning protein
MERNVLGRGLSALMPEAPQAGEKVQNIPTDKIRPSIFQPRKRFADDRLKELAESISEKGVIQPILVRKNQDGYEIIAGERRYRAVTSLGHKDIPAIIKNVSDEDLLEISIIENVQREELNKIEEAKAYERLADEFGMTHDDIAKKVSKERTTITNALRLLDLPKKIQEFLEEGLITAGHARCFLSVQDEKKQIRFCEKVIRQNLSVRQTENLARETSSGNARKKIKRQRYTRPKR